MDCIECYAPTEHESGLCSVCLIDAVIAEEPAANTAAMAIEALNEAATHPAAVATLSVRVEVPAAVELIDVAADTVRQTDGTLEPAATPEPLSWLGEATPLTGPVICNGCGQHGTGRRYDSAGGPMCPDCLTRRTLTTPFREWLRPRAAEFNHVGQVARHVLADPSIPTDDRDSFEKAFWGSANPRLDVIKDVWASYQKSKQPVGATT